ncbi:MAG: WD40 repeat domain-containing protein, partial [Gemmataceae bacterium]
PLVIGAAAHDGFVLGLSFSPDGKQLLTTGRDLTCKLWDVASGKLLKKYTGMVDNVECVAFSPNGQRFLAGENRIVHVFDTETGKVVHRFEEHTDVVHAVAWLPDGRRALSGGADSTMRLWAVPR